MNSWPSVLVAATSALNTPCFERIERLDQFVLFDQVVHDRDEKRVTAIGLGRQGQCRRRGDTRHHVPDPDPGLGDEPAVDPAVEAGPLGILVGIRPDPAIVMHGGVQRLGAVPDIVTHDTHDIDDVGAGVGDLLGRAQFFKHLQVGEARLQPGVILADGPRREAGPLGRVVGIPGRSMAGNFSR